MLDPLFIPNPYFRLKMVPNVAQTLTISDVFPLPKHDDKAIEAFTEEFRKLIGAKHAFATSSGRAALYVILRALGIGKNNEVIIPTFACRAVADAVLQTGAKPILVDVSPQTGLIDCRSVEASISASTRAIVPIHYQGLPSEMGELKDLADSSSLFLIEDCAHALLAKYYGSTVGTIGDMAFFSFGPDKPFTTGLGGMIIASSQEASTALARAKNAVGDAPTPENGKVIRTLVETLTLHRKEFYGIATLTHAPLMTLVSVIVNPSYQFRVAKITGLAAHLGLVQLRRIRRIIAARITNARALHRALEGSRYIRCPQYDDHLEPVFLRYTVLTRDSEQRRVLVARLKRKGISAGPLNWLTPLHRSEYYSRFCKSYRPLQGAEEFASRFVNLPCHEMLSAPDIVTIGKCLKS